MIPQRGEIWIGNLGRDARGTELGAKISKKTGRRQERRPVLVVSGDAFNEGSNRATVVPLMDYVEGREFARNWAFRIFREEIIQHSQADGTLNKNVSLIDCGQFFTLTHSNGLSDFGNCCGRIEDLKLFQTLTISLQIVVGGGLTAYLPDRKQSSSELNFFYGDVIELHRNGRSRPFLIVSSPAVDLLRDNLPMATYHGTKDVKHITVVPLIIGNDHDQIPGTASIDIMNTSKGSTEVWTAICQEIYTFNWTERSVKFITKVPHVQMCRVNHAIRQYLDLPSGHIDVKA